MRHALSMLWRDKLGSGLVMLAAACGLAQVFVHGDGVRILGVATFLAAVASLFTGGKTADEHDTEYRRSDAETGNARAGEWIEELERLKRSESS